MAYPHYTPPPGSHPPPASATYPYGAYHSSHSAYGHPQTPGAYTYQAPAYQAGVTGYGWTYPYSYVPHPAQHVHTPGPAPQTAASTTVNATPTPAPMPVPQRTTTFTSYTPSYIRESVAATSSNSTTGRGSRKQSNVKGLFTKECENGPC